MNPIYDIIFLFVLHGYLLLTTAFIKFELQQARIRRWQSQALEQAQVPPKALQKL